MGTFVGITGKTEVPEDCLETYVKQMLTVWKYGGMMQYETVRLYGKNITPFIRQSSTLTNGI